MASSLSQRLMLIANALHLYDGIRVLEIGCGTGALAREISSRIGPGNILGIDRSEKAIRTALGSSEQEMRQGRLKFRCVAIENYVLEAGDLPYDIAVAVRVGSLDGRHPELEQKALNRVAAALVPKGKLYIDSGQSVKEVRLSEKRQELLPKYTT